MSKITKIKIKNVFIFNVIIVIIIIFISYARLIQQRYFKMKIYTHYKNIYTSSEQGESETCRESLAV